MAKQTKREFSFTNENLYDHNIFMRIFPQFIEALQQDKLKELHKIVESYYYLTQQFYQKDSSEIETRLFTIHDKLSTITMIKTKSQLIKKNEIEVEAKVELRQIWKEITNHLHSAGYFKKSYAIENNQLALQTGR